MRQLTNSQLSETDFVDWPVHMDRAFQLAYRVWTARPNPRVGCVIVADGEVIGEGWHIGAGWDHAEIMAIKAAQGPALRGASAFVTLEPCAHFGRTPPCADALVEAGVARVIIAMVDPNPKVSGAGVRILEEAGIDVFHMLDFEAQAREMNPGFCSRMERGLPFVRAKLGMSLDGRTALANGESQWITGEAARADVQRLRAQSSAILTGSGTALADDPRLTVRLDQLELDEQERVAAEHALASQPLRVLLDSRMRTPGTAKLFADDAVLVFTGEQAGAHSLPAHVETVIAPAVPAGLNLRSVLESLSRRGCNEVLVEAGPTLVGEFLQAGLVDELVVYMAPRLLGSDARPMLELTGITSLNDTPTFDVIEVATLGHDLRLLLRPAQR